MLKTEVWGRYRFTPSATALVVPRYGRLWTTLDGFALLPLVIVQQAKDIYAEDSTVEQINFVCIEGLLVRATGNGRYQRIGCFIEYRPNLLKTLQPIKPTLMILE